MKTLSQNIEMSENQSLKKKIFALSISLTFFEI